MRNIEPRDWKPRHRSGVRLAGERTGKCQSCGAPSVRTYGERVERTTAEVMGPVALEDGREHDFGPNPVRIEVCVPCLRRFERHNSFARINARPLRIQEARAKQLAAMVEVGLSTRQIAAAFGVTPRKALYWRKKIEARDSAS